ncbi:DUF4199 domain-containing protein [Prevotella sp. KH2C16]|uniref:DUF4199 domain-containing protein n=1 Tax=Prevotella sp. KH2C16 TaxID=1855325 RepID=UPI002100E7CF|nr:DUF4199 domain-containing protein [Prevotella sp. KH2C16]
MTFAEALTQIRAFARQDGFILALAWIGSFASVLYVPQSVIGSLLAMATPFIVIWRLVRFRNDALDGIISFRRGLVYSWFTFFYASLLFCLAQYVYFRFLDKGLFNSILINATQVMSEVYQTQGIDAKDFTDAVSVFTSMKPIQLSFVFMMQNIFMGTIMSLPIAALCMRRGPYKRNYRK